MDDRTDDKAHDSRSLFCSYARVDRDAVYAITERLQLSNYSVWIDVDDIRPAVEWMRDVETAIDNAAAFVLFLSPAYIESEACRHEASRAREDGKKIIPVLLQQCEARGELSWISELNWIDTTRGSDAVAEAILTAASSNTEWQDYHRRLLLQAREWVTGARRTSRLLRGDDIAEAHAALAASRLPSDPQPTTMQREFVTASARHQRRRRQRVTTIGALVTTLSVTLSVFAVAQRNTATNERSKADIARIAAEDAQTAAEEAQVDAETARAAAEDALAESELLQSEAEARVLANASLSEPDPTWAALYAIDALFRTATPLQEAREAWLKSSRRVSELVLIPSGLHRVDESSEVISVAPDGHHLLVRTGDDDAVIIDPTGHDVVPGLGPISTASWRPDGELVAVDDGRETLLIDLNGTTTTNNMLTGQRPMTWSPDGLILVTHDEDSLSFFTVDSNSSISSLGSIPSGFSVPRLTWSADSHYLALSGTELLGDFPDPYVQVIDLWDGRVGGLIFGNVASSHRALAFQEVPAGWELLFGARADGLARVQEQEFFEPEPYSSTASELDLGDQEVVVAATSPNGRNLAFGLSDGSLHVGSSVVAEGDGSSAVTLLAWHPSGTYVVGASTSGQLIIADKLGAFVGELPGRYPAQTPRDLSWSDDGESLVVAWRDGDIVSYHFSPVPDAVGYVASEAHRAIAWSPDGTRVAIGDDDGVITIVPVDGTSTGVTYQPSDAGVVSGYSVWDLAWSPNGDYLAAEYLSGGLAVVSGSEKRLVGSMEMRWTGPMGLSWDPASTRVATIDADFQPLLMSTTGEWTWFLQTNSANDETYFDARFMPDGALALRTSESQLIIHESDGSERMSVDLGMAPSSTGGSTVPLLIADDDGLHLVDSNGDLRSISPATSSRHAVSAWSPDGRHIALALDDFTVSTFDTNGDVVESVDIPARQPISAVHWGGDNVIYTLHDDGAVWMVDLTAAAPSLIELGLPPVEDFVPSPQGVNAITTSSTGEATMRTVIQANALCDELIAMVDEEQYRDAVAQISSLNSCTSDANLDAIITAPTSLSRPDALSDDTQLGNGVNPTGGDPEPRGDPDDLSAIADSFGNNYAVIGPIEANGRYYAIAATLEDYASNDLSVWEFDEQMWRKNDALLEPGGYYPYIVALIELDVDDDGTSEFLVRFAPNGFVGVVFRLVSGVWVTIGGGENLDFVPGVGLVGMGNDCEPSCAEGTAVPYTLVWDGDRLAYQPTD